MQTLLVILSHVPCLGLGHSAFLVVMGLMQSRDQLMSRPRLMILPMVWLAFGAWGVKNAFGSTRPRWRPGPSAWR